MIIKNELRKKPWYTMFSDAKHEREVVIVLARNEVMRHRSEQKLSDFCSTSKKLLRTVF